MKIQWQERGKKALPGLQVSFKEKKRFLKQAHLKKKVKKGNMPIDSKVLLVISISYMEPGF